MHYLHNDIIETQWKISYRIFGRGMHKEKYVQKLKIILYFGCNSYLCFSIRVRILNTFIVGRKRLRRRRPHFRPTRTREHLIVREEKK